MTNFCYYRQKETEQIFSRFLQNSQHISEIRLKQISNEGLRLIAASQCGPSLLSIKAEVDDDSLEVIKSLFPICPNIRSLDLENYSVVARDDEVILTALQYCPLIEVLPTANLTDISLNALATIHTLRDLKLFDYVSCSSQAIQYVLQSNPHMQSLDLQGSHLDDALVNCIGRYCGNLKRLELYRDEFALSNNILIELFRGCPLLESFRLLHSGRLSSATLRAMFEYCPHLAELALPYDHLTIEPLVADPILFTQYPSLTKLKVRGNSVSDSGLRSIFTYCNNLREVDICHCQHITDDTITCLAQNCTYLDTLYIMGCDKATATGVLEMVTYCSSLTSLFLSSMPINDEVLIQLSLHCHNLISLYILDCKELPITEVGVLAVVERCTHLTSLSLVDTLIPSTDLTSLPQLYPHVTFKIEKWTY